MTELSKSPASPPLLLMALALVVMAIVGAWFGSQNRVDLRSTLAPVVETRSFVFVPGEDDALAVLDAEDGATVTTFPSGEANFIRGMLRAVDRERQVNGVAPDSPLVVSARADRSITVIDEGTGIVYDLRAFGGENQAVFADLLAMPSGADGIAGSGGNGEGNLQTRAAVPASP